MSGVEEQIQQVRSDLAELDEQIAAGEIDAATGERLRRRYLAELDAAATTETDSPPSRSTPRLLVGGAILLVGFATTIAVLGSSVESGDSGALQGVAAVDQFNPEDYSDETMEAVIAANRDDPAVAGQLGYIRFALAERYFDRGDFQRAFAHYEAILGASPPTDLFAATMTRIAWITFVGNGEVELSLDVIERAIEAAPASTEARYVKGQILWCGAGDDVAAVSLFEQVLASDQLDDATRAQVEADLAAAAAGAPCT
ncbi:MAG TPA: tetratricopeptide repeat protein [Acidimicrobiia bacterium]|nr:tetratricopeptide repeat protein [Acidimicrobiia bacterium]